MKRCWKCKEVKEITYFFKNKSNKDGLEKMCKNCKTLYHKKKKYDEWGYKITKWESKGDHGVYKIINLITNEVYIGKGWLIERKYDHFYKLKHQKHDNPFFQESFNLNPNIDCWEFTVLERCDEVTAIEKERDYIIKEYIKEPKKLLNKKLDLRF